MSSERLHITTVDQHVGNHKPTGIEETSYDNTIGARLYRARTLAGISQSELAQAIGTTKAGVSIVEKNQRIPTLDWLIRAARALGVSGAVLSGDLADRIPPANPKS